jgi:hypothetical protein
LELVSQFPFLSDPHKAAWFAGLLTPFGRHAVAGPCPLFLFESASPGTGKTILADLVAVAAAGREMPRSTFSEKEEEQRKVITAVALGGDRLHLFDNVSVPFGGGPIDAALTGTAWKDRMLGESKMTLELPLHCLFYATGNNVFLKGDVRRRIVPSRLEADCERPEERTGFKIPNLLEHVRQTRPQIVADALTILRAFELAGRPTPKLRPKGSYEAWCALVRGAVLWVTGSDPCDACEDIQVSDAAATDLETLLAGWAKLPLGKTGCSARDAIKAVNQEPVAHEDLFELFVGWGQKGTMVTAKSLGSRLTKMRGRVAAGLKLRGVDYSGRPCVWSAVPLTR